MVRMDLGHVATIQLRLVLWHAEDRTAPASDVAVTRLAQSNKLAYLR